MNQETIRSYKKPIMVGILLLSILVNGGFFPIINFNPANPVERDTVMGFIILVMTCVFHKEVGTLEAIVFSKLPLVLIGMINVAVVLGALGCRYLIEFGEVSNTYNFTILNIAFQVMVLALISSVSCLLERMKR